MCRSASRGRSKEPLQRPRDCQHGFRIGQLAELFARPRVAADPLGIDEEGAADVERPESDRLLPEDAERPRCLGVPVRQQLLPAEEALLVELLRPGGMRVRRILRQAVDPDAQRLELLCRSSEPDDLKLSAAFVAAGEVEDVDVEDGGPVRDQPAQPDGVARSPAHLELRHEVSRRDPGHRSSVVVEHEEPVATCRAAL
jgi:hypothetical protein